LRTKAVAFVDVLISLDSRAIPRKEHDVANCTRAKRRVALAPPGDRLLPVVFAAGLLCAAAPAEVRAGPDPCTGVGTVTCSGNQSAGVDNPPPGTTVLNVNSLTRDIAPDPATGRPGILFFGTGNISLVSATGPFAIVQRGTFTDGIVAESDQAVNVTTSGAISVGGTFANGINVISDAGGPIAIATSSKISLANGGDAISADTAGGIAVSSSGALSVVGDGIGISATGGLRVVVNSSGGIFVGGAGTAIDAIDRGGPAPGGGVTVVSSGAISMAGSNAIGIDASSEDTDPVSVTSSGSITLARGGNAILASSTGAVTVTSSGAISIAGGAGGGIVAGSDASGTVSVTSSGNVSITGDGAAIIAASASGATNVVSSGRIVVGGSGLGISAIGGSAASVISSGDISLGGGGNAINAISERGDATVTSSGNLAIAGAGAGIGVATDRGAAKVSSSGTISIGGDGDGISVSSRSGSVSVTSSGSISIGGDGDGISASSERGPVSVTSSGSIRIGGDGSGIDLSGTQVLVNSSGAILVGGAGFGVGIEASGRTVTVNSSSPISVLGVSNAGILVEGGSVAVSSSGAILAAGERSAGINATGSSGVKVASSANVTAAASGSTAIFTQASGGAIAVTIAGGTVTGGSGLGAGVALIGGGNNSLANFGSIGTSAGLAGFAIRGAPALAVVGNNRVDNAGTIVGNVDLGPGRNAFNNLAGGVFDTGAVARIGAGGTLGNSGNLSPGGRGVFQTTALTGNLVQRAGGTLTMDLDPATGRADRIDASGTANLGGRVALALTGVTPTVGSTTSVLVHAAGGATDGGLELGALPAVAAYRLEFPNGVDVVLQGGLNFAPAGLNANQAAIGQSINSIQLAGGSPSFRPIVQSILAIPSVSGLAQAYDQLSPETYGDNEISDFYSGRRFADSLMSCKSPDGRYAFIKEQQCVWAQIGGKFLNLTGTSDNLGFNESAVVLAGGGEVMFQPDWFASFAVGYENGSTGIGNGLANSVMDRAHLGAAIKYNPGPFLFSAAVYGGYGWYTTDRSMDFGGFNATASSDSRISNVGAQFRAAYLIDRGSWYVKPLLDLNVTHVNLNGFTEHGAGGANLIVSGNGETLFSASPAVEIGTQMALANGALLRPYAKLGLSVYSNTDFSVDASFAGAPAGAAPFRVTTGIDTLTADVAAGADLFLPQSPLAFKLAYSGRYGGRVRDQGFRLKASFRF
jgi:uncharacterized protein with beta-barrel porin domain